MHTTIDIPAGTDISTAAKMLCTSALLPRGQTIGADFNGIQIFADHRDTPDKVVDRWLSVRRAQEEARRRGTIIKEHRAVYISGPMTGLPGFNFPAFDKAAVTLAADGWVPLNPAELERQEHHGRDYSQYDGHTPPPGFCLETTAYRDLEAVHKCDAIYMLKGWEKSKGAKAEKALAEWLGKEVMYEQLKDDRICAVCDGRPGNEGVCLCGLHAYEDEEKAEAPIFPDTDAGRREYPLCTGLLEYFPRACAETAHRSHIGNEQHNPGEPLHWAKEKSIGRGDQIVRHLMDGKTAKDRAEAIHHFAGMCWRSLELFERFLQGLEPFDR